MRRPGLTTTAAALAVVGVTLSFRAVTTDWSWWPWALLTILAVFGAAALARVGHRPGWVAPVASGAALFVAFLIVGGRNGGVLPAPTALADVWPTLSQGLRDATSHRPPISPTPGVILLLALVAGVVAWLVDLIAVTLRQATLTGLPLLALYTAIAAIAPGSVGWLSFTVGAAGYLALLLVAQRAQLSAWGKSAGAAQPWSIRGLVVDRGRAMAALGICCALLAVAVIPGQSGQGWLTGMENWRMFGQDGQAVRAIHPMTQLRGELRRGETVELLRVRSSDPDPFYLRVATLDIFNKSGWTQRELRGGVEDRVVRGMPNNPYLAASAPTVRQRTSIEIRGFTDSPYLPIYANPTAVAARGDWRWDAAADTVFTTRTTTKGLQYTVESERVRYDAAGLRGLGWPKVSPAAASKRPSAPQSVRDLVETLTADADTQYDAVLALTEHFAPANGYVYDEQAAAGTSGDALVDFLELKRGYCEQYASALAYLVRVAGLPSRVAIGFGYGDQQRSAGSAGEGDFRSITSRDAHAWVEVLFPGQGWVPFDPTPASGTNGRTGGLEWTDGGRAAPPPTNEPSPEDPDSAGVPEPTDDPGGAPAAGPREETAPREIVRSSNGGNEAIALVLLVGAGALGLALTPAMLRLWIRHRRYRLIRRGARRTGQATGAPASKPTAVAVELAWRELLATTLDLGTPRRPAETPRNFVRRLLQAPEGEPSPPDQMVNAVTGLVTVYEHAHFAATPLPYPKLGRATEIAIAGLLDAAPSRTRAAAFFLPRSLLPPRS